MKHNYDKDSRLSALVAPALDPKKRGSFSSYSPLISPLREGPSKSAVETLERLGGSVRVVGEGSLGVMKGVTSATKVLLKVPVPTKDNSLDEELGKAVSGMGFELLLPEKDGRKSYVVAYNGPSVDDVEKLAKEALRTVELVEEKEVMKRMTPKLPPAMSVEERTKTAEEQCKSAARTVEVVGGSLKVEAGVSSPKVNVEVPVETSDRHLDEVLAEHPTFLGVELLLQKSGEKSRYVVRCSTRDVDKVDETVKKAMNAAKMVVSNELSKEREVKREPEVVPASAELDAAAAA